ncbi:MAG: N-acetyltransferase family protein [Candidatus Kapaibacterium sp.]
MIRELHSEDLPELALLAARTYSETFGYSLTPEELEVEIKEHRSEAYFRSVIGNDTLLGAILDDKLVGYVQFGDVKVEVKGVQPGSDDRAVHALYVHSDAQWRGFGRLLMDAAFNHSQIRNARNIFIDVWEENRRALNFYLQYGFVEVGTCDVVVDGNIVGSDLVLMRSVKNEDESTGRRGPDAIADT